MGARALLPSGRPKQPLKDGQLAPTEARALRLEAAKRFGLLAPESGLVLTPSATNRDVERQHAFLKSLFPEQLAFIRDPSKRKVACCGRRSGKTVVLLFEAAKASRNFPACTIPYIALDRESAKRLFWRPLKTLNKQYGMGLKFNEGSLTATMPNGSMIWLLGAKDEDDIEKLRGDRYPLVLVDESASFKAHIQMMVQDVVEPALEDLDGTLCLAGNPGRIPAGMYYDITTGRKPEWSVHHWTVLQNACFPRWAGSPTWKQDAVAWLERLRKAKGWSLEDPVYRREWLGEWVEDNEVMVYRFNRHRNVFDTLPQVRDWFYIMGIDFGFDPDPTAFSIGAFSPTSVDYYVLETFAKTHMLADDVAAMIRHFEARYGTFIKKVGDSSGRQFFSELNQRKGVNVAVAQRKDKLDFIEHMNSDFLQGRIKVRASDPIVEDYVKLVWNAERTAEHQSRANHRTDATLYAWRESRHWAGRIPDPEVDPTSEDGINAQMRVYLERAEREESRARQELLECQEDTPWFV